MLRVLSNVSVGLKLVLAFAVVIAASGIAGGIAWLRLADIDQAVGWNEHTY